MTDEKKISVNAYIKQNGKKYIVVKVAGSDEAIFINEELINYAFANAKVPAKKEGK